ncbi:ISSpo6, transposase OrfB, partial [Brucella intermedia M86]
LAGPEPNRNGISQNSKALLRKRAARSFDAISKALGDIISLFSINECQNFFKAAGYEAE